MSDELISVNEIAELAGERPATISTWKYRHPDFPEERESRGRQKLFERSEIIAWLERHRPNYGTSGAKGRTGEAIRAIARSDTGPDVALALLCLAALAPDQLAAVIDDEGWPEAVAALSERVEERREMPGLLGPLREGGTADLVTQALALTGSADSGLRSREELARVFEAVLSERAGAWSRRVAIHRSPDWLAELMFDLVSVALTPGALLLDPAVGEGGFLVTAALRASVQLELRGWELDPGNARVARERLLVHGLAGEVDTVDSLGTDRIRSVAAAAVISDPPLGLRLDASRWQADDERWRDYAFPEPHGDLAWVLLALHHLARDGRAAILTARGALFRGRSEALIRRRLLETGAIEAVIALPGGSSLQSGVPLALWLLHKPGSAPPSRVLFIDASDASMQRPTTRTGAEELARSLADRIRAAIAGWRREPDEAQLTPGFATAHRTSDLATGDAVLDPVRLVRLPASSEQLASELTRVRAEHDRILAELSALRLPETHDGERTTARRIKLGELLASDRAQLYRGRRTGAQIDGAGRKVLGPWTFDGEPARHSESAEAVVNAGDVVVVPRRRGFRARVAAADEDGAALEAPLQAIHLQPTAGGEMASLTPSLLAELINIEMPASAGTTGRPAVNALEIPLLSADAARELEKALAGLRAEAELAARLQATRARLQLLLVAQHAR